MIWSKEFELRSCKVALTSSLLVKMSAPMVNVFLGAETGILKDVNIGDKTSWKNVNSIQTADKRKEIVCMCYASQNQNQIAVALRDRTVQVYDSGGEVTNEYSFSGGEGPLKGICKCDDNFVTCAESGLLQVWEGGESKAQIDCGENIYRMRQDPNNPHIIGTGGKENDLKIWNLNTPEEPVFRAKNVRHDFLELRVPVWVTDVAFVPGGRQVVTSTGHHQVRMYDIKSVQRRPVMDMEFDEYPITAFSLCSNENQAVIGNTHGNMALIDFRKGGKMVQCYKGFSGAIRSIQCHGSLPLVASCGLDRFLHVHNINTREQLHKIYLKSRLNCLLFVDTQSNETEDMQTEESGTLAEAENFDELWDEMEKVGTKPKTRKQMSENNRTSVTIIDTKRKGKKRKNVQLKNVFYEERSADQITEPIAEQTSVEVQPSVKRKKKKKKGSKVCNE